MVQWTKKLNWGEALDSQTQTASWSPVSACVTFTENEQYVPWTTTSAGTVAPSWPDDPNRAHSATIPHQSDCLQIWLRVNEGAGTAVTDYSGNSHNAHWQTTFGDPTAKVWQVDGFGYNSSASPATNIHGDTLPNTHFNLAYITMGGFIKPIGGSTGAFPDMYYSAMRLGHTSPTFVEFGWKRDRQWSLQSTGHSQINTGVYLTYGKWYFVVLRFGLKPYYVKLSVRESGGALTTLWSSQSTVTVNYTTGTFNCFGMNDVSYQMIAGDLFWFSGGYDGTHCYLTDAELNMIYECFRGRFDMR